MQETTWDCDQIKGLRRRLGWSQAELARQLSCSVELIRSWETDCPQLDKEVLDQLDRWSNAAEDRSEKLQLNPLKERDLADQGVEQIFDTD